MNRIKGRMFVVDDSTIETTINTGIASIKMPELQTRWFYTISSMISDLLQIEPGDYIFLWKTKSNELSSKSKIYGVYRAISKPYYELTNNDDKYPFKIHIEEAYHFENPITEYEILNCPYLNYEPWTIVGKKVANKPRGTSPLSMEEIKSLITLLINKNPNFTYNSFDQSRIININNQITISYNNRIDNVRPTDLTTLNPNDLSYIDRKGLVRVEKVLEGVFNQEMVNRNSQFFDQIDIDVNKVIWFNNYLPYSIDAMEFDYVVMESEDGFTLSKIKLIEFRNDVPDEDHLNRAIVYSKWLNERMVLGCKIVEPIFICTKCDQISSTIDENYLHLDDFCHRMEYESNVKPLKIFTYKVDDNNMFVFERKR